MISTDNANTGDSNSPGQSGVNRPNLVGAPFQSGPCNGPYVAVHTAAHWFNPCAFADSAPNTYGNAGRNSLLGPGYGSFDLSLLRRFSLPERTTLTFEVESFNLFNKPNFDLPQAFTDQPTTSGQISSADQRGQNPRQLQLAARLSF
jgi:hypothetical protein